MRAFRLCVCLLGLAFGTGRASAGPIWFTFRTDGSVTQNGAGDISFNPVNSGPIVLDPKTNPGLILGFVQFGGTTPLSVQPGTGGASTPEFRQSRFALNVQITDTTSSQVGVARFTGVAGIGSTRTPTGSMEWDLFSISFDQSSEQLMLGGNTYNVTATGAHGDTPSGVTGTIGVNAGTSAQSPEPGTLALAGIGIAALVGFAIRRKV